MRIFKSRKSKSGEIEYAYLCHKGNVRKENQDNIFLCIDDDMVICKEEMETSGNGSSKKSIKCAVFDGMGGMSQGEEASLIAANVIAKNKEIANTEEFVYGNIGDSRLYLLKKGKLQQCSIDHTVTQPYTGKRLLMQYLGMDADYEIELHLGRQKVEQGSEILLCSDGLTDCLCDEEIETILNNNNKVEMQIKELLDTALQREAQDNISIILCRWE